MSPNPLTSDGGGTAGKPDRAWWIGLILACGVLLWFYGFITGFGPVRQMSALWWIWDSWNPETDSEHGVMFPFLIAGMLILRRKQLREAAGPGDWRGLILVVLGAATYVIAHRALQPRIAIGGLPITLLGCAWFLWGWRLTRMLAFPLCFIWLAVPMPSFQQATVGLQQLATQLAHRGSSLFGVETYTQGTLVLPVHGNWKALDIAKGCSGIRSLMALLMVSAAWAYFAQQLAMWKRALLVLSSIPLAVIGNALRVISIFVIAQHGNAEWATHTWHDWSGLLLFYPISLLLMLGLHTLLEGGLPWGGKRGGRPQRVVVRQQVEAP